MTFHMFVYFSSIYGSEHGNYSGVMRRAAFHWIILDLQYDWYYQGLVWGERWAWSREWRRAWSRGRPTTLTTTISGTSPRNAAEPAQNHTKQSQGYILCNSITPPPLSIADYPFPFHIACLPAKMRLAHATTAPIFTQSSPPLILLYLIGVATSIDAECRWVLAACHSHSSSLDHSMLHNIYPLIKILSKCRLCFLISPSINAIILLNVTQLTFILTHWDMIIV